MIAVQLQGQLGNQLFQIAFIRLASSILNEKYVFIDDNSYGCIVEKYFILKFYERKYFRRILNKYFFLNRRETIEFNNWQGTELILSLLKPGIIYKGFFQSENFFKGITHKYSFSIKEEFKRDFKKQYGEIFKNHKTLVIHIRLKDYLLIGDEKLGGKGLQLPLEYYNKAIKGVEVDDNTKVFVISDDPEFVRENLKLDVPFSIETNHFIIDLLLLVNANTLILSNSSFSWWGAFLNTSDNLKVIAPKYWMGFKVEHNYPLEILPSSWSTVTVP